MATKEFKPFVLRPEQLVRYVGYAYTQKQIRVVGIHIAQLASLVGIVPTVNGRPQQGLPMTFILPEQVDNIHEILASAKAAYPKSGSWWK